MAYRRVKLKTYFREIIIVKEYPEKEIFKKSTKKNHQTIETFIETTAD